MLTKGLTYLMAPVCGVATFACSGTPLYTSTTNSDGGRADGRHENRDTWNLGAGSDGADNDTLDVTMSRKTVLVVVGDRNIMTPGETSLVERLKARGLSPLTSSSATTAVEEGRDARLIVIVNAGLGEFSVFRTVAVPVIVMDRSAFPDMHMTGARLDIDYGDSLSKDVIIDDPSHPMAGNMSGTISLSDEEGMLGWGAPSLFAARIASIKDDSSHIVLFGYASGADMVGMRAPGARVGYAPWSSTVASFTGAGFQLFDAAVDWVLQN